MHLAVDRDTGDVVGADLAASSSRDAARVPALLNQVNGELASFSADTAYDKEAVYEAVEAHSTDRRTRVVIPPQKGAQPSTEDLAAMQDRNRHIRSINRIGRRRWYLQSGFTKRSTVENVVCRYKTILGPAMMLARWPGSESRHGSVAIS